MLSKARPFLFRHRKFIVVKLALLVAFGGVFPGAAFAGGVQTLDTVEVNDSAENLFGSADSSTEGSFPY